MSDKQIHLISYVPNFLPGQTLDTNFGIAQAPFDISTLSKLFDQETFGTIPLTSRGSGEEVYQIVMDSSSKIDALGVKGSLALTYGPVSGDANVSFAMNNINSSLSLSIIYRISHVGQNRRVDLDDLNKIQLSETVLKNTNLKSIDDFKKQYGSYIIIGFESGGEVLYDCTYTTKDSEDKTAVAGGLSLKYSSVPDVSISGSVNGDYSKADITKSLNVKTSFKINPSTDSKEQEDLLGYLNEFTNIASLQKSDKTALNTLKDNISKTANAILNPSDNNDNEEKLDWIKAIIYPIEAVPCVSKIFTQTESNMQSISGFLKYLNNLYIDLKSKYDSMIAMTWTNPSDEFETYAVKISEIIQLLETLSDYDSLSTYGKKYNDYIYGITDDDTKDDSKDNDSIDDKQIDIPVNEFYKIHIFLFDIQYNNDILIPYNKYITSNNGTAVLKVWVDNNVTVVQQNGTDLPQTIIDNFVSTSDTNALPVTVTMTSINKDTVVTFECGNDGGMAYLMAQIDYNNNIYRTPSTLFQCTSTEFNWATPLYCWPNNIENFSIKNFDSQVMRVWPNNIQQKEKQTFEFKFSNVINN